MGLSPNDTLLSMDVAPNETLLSMDVCPNETLLSMDVAPNETVLSMDVFPNETLLSMNVAPNETLLSMDVSPNETLLSMDVAPNETLLSMGLSQNETLLPRGAAPRSGHQPTRKKKMASVSPFPRAMKRDADTASRTRINANPPQNRPLTNQPGAAASRGSYPSCRDRRSGLQVRAVACCVGGGRRSGAREEPGGVTPDATRPHEDFLYPECLRRGR